MNFNIEINNKKLEAASGDTLLETLNKNGIKVPTLCHMKGMIPSGACRICVVEQADGKLIPSCSYPVHEGMNIKTHSPKVIEARKTIVELLLSNHPDDCLFCVRNGNCELQSLSEELLVRQRKIRGKKNQHKLDLSSSSIHRDPAKCILCGRCVRMCEEIMTVSAIDFINRGNATIVGTTFNRGLNTSSCINCGQCIMVCPTGALTENSNIPEVQQALIDPSKHVVIQYAPAISVSIAEAFGLDPGKDMNGILNAALRKIGFHTVFDTTFAADLTIMEESAELLQRINNNKNLPMITSCCPGWVKFAEEFYPEMLPNVSTCKSPQQMQGALIKSYYAEKMGIDPQNIYSIAIMPCTAKKFEGGRSEMTKHGISDVDANLTTRELVELIKLYGIDINKLDSEMADSPMGIRSSAGKLFGATGGVMEAALRTAYFKLTGKELINFKIQAVRGNEGIKEAHIDVNGLNLGVAVAHGMGNARKLLEAIKAGKNDIHFIEIMACPSGCIGGGGQLINNNPESIKARMKALYQIDDQESIKVSHKNPEVIELYKNFLGEPLGHKSHELLHTTYCQRDVII